MYELPFGAGKRYWNGGGALEEKLLNGWQAQGIVVISTGFPFTPTANPVHNTGSFIPQFADRIADGNLPHGQRSPTRWLDTAAFARPAIGTFGSSGRNVLIGPGVGNVDFSLIKRYAHHRARQPPASRRELQSVQPSAVQQSGWQRG